MKPFLGINLTFDKENEVRNGEEFIIQRPSDLLIQSLEKATDAVVENFDKSQFPILLKILYWISGIAGFSIILGISEYLTEGNTSLIKLYNAVNWLFWLAGICLIIFCVLTFTYFRRFKKHFESDESNQVYENHDSVCEAIYTELNLPANSVEVDILSFYYKEKSDKIKICNTDYQLAPYESNIFYTFVENNKLILIDTYGRYEFSLGSIKAIHTYSKTITIDEWTKDEPHNKGIYKQYKLRENDNGCIICKGYSIIEIEHNGELWGIYVPLYELSVFESLIGIESN